MNDTHPHIETFLRRCMMEKSGEERLKMGFSMYEFSRKLVESSLRFSQPEISEIVLRQKIFLRFYGDDFNENQKAKILASIAQVYGI